MDGAMIVRHRLKCECKITGTLKAQLRLFLQAMSDNSLERSGDPVVHNQIWWLHLQYRVHSVCIGIPLKGLLSGNHLIKDGTEAEDICAMIDLLGSQLFWRDVTRRAHQGT